MGRYQNYSRKNVYYQPRSVKKTEKRLRRNLILTILVIFSITYAAFTWGIPALIGSLSVFNKLKPETKKEKITENSAIAPPVLSIPFEATNSAHLPISGYASSNSEIEIFLDEQSVSKIKTEGDGGFKTDPIILSLGTNNITAVTINEKGEKSFPSKNIRLIFSNEKPKIEVSEPADGKVVQGGDKKTTISGKTDPTNSVTVNGSTVIVNSDGQFQTTVELSDGDNIVIVIATNNVGNTTQIQKKVTYIP